jgi:glycosyltransferase involved in cell wall biosynthesis
MKILQLTKNYPPQFGGIELVTFDLTEGLNANQIRCDVLCSNIVNETVIEEKADHTIYRAATVKNISSTDISFETIKLLSRLKNRYDIIQVHFPNPMAALAVFLTRPKSKIVVHWHNDVIKQTNIYGFYKPLEQWVLRKAVAIVGTSEKYVYASQALKNHRGKLRIIPIGISTERFILNEHKLAELKTSYQGKRVIFSLGRLVYYKSFEHLVEAASYLPDDTIILIGGTGELKEDLQRLIRERKLEEKVKLIGRIPDEDIAAYYQACDIFCLPSAYRTEGFGVVLVEAMFFGKPIVATQIPGSGVSWVNQEGYTGFNAPIADPKVLADLINRILGDDKLAEKLSKNGLARFKDNFTRENMVNRFITLFKELVH